MPIAVVQNNEGKMRLIVDGRMLNMQLARLPFRHETAADATRMFTDMDWVWTLDVKAGSHHALMKPEVWTFLRTHFENR